MIPLNYAILNLFTKIERGSADTVMEKLKAQYGNFKAFKKEAIVNALMTAEANGLLEEAKIEMDEENNLRIYYRAHEEGAATINRYIRG
jgi:DNA-binding PadR family transcriptional regulator